MSKYNIAGIPIEVMFSNGESYNIYPSFYYNFKNKAQLTIKIKNTNNINIPYGKLIIDEVIKWYEELFDNSLSIYIYDENIKKYIYKLKVDKKWENACIEYCDNVSNGEFAFAGPLGEILFRNKILFHQGIVVHSSFVNWNGKGIMFTAPSGTGKSTQANLWKSYMDAIIINEDRSVVKINDNKVIVYGTPWNGSSVSFMNSDAPLSAIIVLEQADKNSIRKLNKCEAITYVMPRCFLPYFDSDLIDKAISTIEKIIEITPVYLLKCRPDREAVELVYQCVK